MSFAFRKWLAAVLIVQATWVARSESSDHTVAAQQLVEQLVKEDFAGVVGRFGPEMKAALPETRLRDAWHGVREWFGPFERQLSTKVEKHSARVTCQFLRGKADVKIGFDDEGRVDGLFFSPADLSAISKSPPPYADTNAFQEKEFTIASGKRSLPGTLAVPARGRGPWPAVVLVHGSGALDRDETVDANRPFRDLAWGLAAKGVAVLRYDKRTKVYGAKSFDAADGTFTVQEETIDDALAAVAQLRAVDGVDAKRIFLLGHSLGGSLAPRIARADSRIAGLILLAGATRPMEDLILEQNRYLLSFNGAMSPEEEAQLKSVEALAAKIKSLTPADASSSELIAGAPPRYWLDLRDYNQASTAAAVSQPLLILQGGRDYQVTTVDFEAWKTALAGRRNVAFKLYPKLNHLFIAGEGRSTPAEYGEPGTWRNPW